MPKFLVHSDLKYPTNVRANRENWEWKDVAAGEIVDDIPTKSRPWLLEQGYIEEVEDEPEGEGSDG